MKYTPPASRTRMRYYLVFTDASRRDVDVAEGPASGYAHPDRLASEQSFDTPGEAVSYRQRVLVMARDWKPLSGR